VRNREEKSVELLELEDEKHNKVDFHGLLFVTEGAQGLADGDKLRVEEEEAKEEH